MTLHNIVGLEAMRLNFARESDTRKKVAILLISFSMFLMVCSSYSAKALLKDYPPEQLLFLRCVGYVFLMFIPTVLLCGTRGLIRELDKNQIILGVVGIVAAFVFLLALSLLSVSEAVALLYTYPIIMYLFGIVFLREKSTYSSWIAVLVCFLGVCLIASPSKIGSIQGVSLALISALLLALRFLLVRRLTVKSDPFTTAYLERLVGTIAVLIPAVLVWKSINEQHYTLVLALTVFGVLAQITFVCAVMQAELRVLAPYVNLEIAFALLFDIFVFEVALSAPALIGLVLIVFCTIVVSRSRI